mmetsp:Transcript_25123/g.64711  ORF Transcript_25123/g.64711 Transcript_25123/m.64711 type:complete len:273 (+) Transcript_25123:314-1132(+)
MSAPLIRLSGPARRGGARRVILVRSVEAIAVIRVVELVLHHLVSLKVCLVLAENSLQQAALVVGRVKGGPLERADDQRLGQQAVELGHVLGRRARLAVVGGVLLLARAVRFAFHVPRFTDEVGPPGGHPLPPAQRTRRLHRLHQQPPLLLRSGAATALDHVQAVEQARRAKVELLHDGRVFAADNHVSRARVELRRQYDAQEAQHVLLLVRHSDHGMRLAPHHLPAFACIHGRAVLHDMLGMPRPQRGNLRPGRMYRCPRAVAYQSRIGLCR